MRNVGICEWTKAELIEMNDKGYNKFYKAENEEDAKRVAGMYRDNGDAARAGWIINKEKEKIYFVMIKKKEVA